MAKPTTAAATTSDAALFVSSEPAQAGYVSLRAAAKLIGVSASTLSRRKDLLRVSAGQEERVPAAEVIRLAATYQRTPLSSVAGALVAHAAAAGADVQHLVADEVDGALEWFSEDRRNDQHGAFIAEAHHRLPRELALQIERTLTWEGPVTGFTGWSPDGD